MPRLVPVALFGALLVTPFAAAENWPQWRGPDGTGISRETGLPTHWNDTRGIAWKTALPEWGTSTPVVWNEALFLTSHAGDDLLLLKVNARTGQIEWTQKVGQGAAPRMPLMKKSDTERREQKFHKLHNLASPSPVTDGKFVVAHFGNGDLAAYDFAGNQKWKRNLQDDYGTYTIWWGHANSPVIYQNLVISACMQDSLADIDDKPTPSYVVAHDLETGKEVWKMPRMTGAKAEEGDSYTTPLFHTIDGQAQMIIMGGNQVDAYDPLTGKQLWFLPNIVGGRTVTGPTLGNDLVFVTQGKSGPLLAVRIAGSGEKTKDAVLWKDTAGTPDSSCPVFFNNHLFTVTDGGVGKCYDARGGQIKWKERINAGDYKASPLVAEGRIYYVNTAGLCTIISASDRFEKLAENQIDDETIASPIAANGKLYLRGKKHLWCLATPK